MEHLCGKDSHKIAGGITLITSSNPIDFTLTNFNNLLEMLKENGIESTKKIISTYQKETEEYNDKLKRLEERVKSDDIRSQKIQQLQESAPKINFPNMFQINTKKHILKFASKNKQYIDRNHIRGEFPPEKHPDNFAIDDKLKLLLWCGVAIYNPNTHDENKLDREYTNYVHQLLTNNQLAIVISNKKIMYGSNYPIRTVISSEEFSKKHSMNSLFQLFGRAGRVGLAFRATVYIDNEMAKRLYNFIHIDSAYNSIEVDNMNKLFQILAQEEFDKLVLESNKKIKEKEAYERRINDKIKEYEFKKSLTQSINTSLPQNNSNSYDNKIKSSVKNDLSYAQISHTYDKRKNDSFYNDKYHESNHIKHTENTKHTENKDTDTNWRKSTSNYKSNYNSYNK